MRRLLLAFLALVACTFSAGAGEEEELIARQRARMKEILQKIEVVGANSFETENLLVCGNFPEDRIKKLGETGQKYYAAAFKGLKFEMLDSGPKGKLAVYIFDELGPFRSFVRHAEGHSVDKDDRQAMDARGDMPHVAVALSKESKEPAESVLGSAVAQALLICKGGPSLIPGWMKQGFGKAVVMRLSPSTSEGDRRKIRSMLQESKTRPAKYKLDNVWDAETPYADRALLQASLMEYMVFSPDSTKLLKILQEFRVGEKDKPPTFAEALKSGSDITPENIDKNWKKWVANPK